jgi:hypothetical protein
MKKLLLAAVLVALVGLAPSAYAAQFAFHGDLNNRFQLYTNQNNFFTLNGGTPTLDGTTDQFASIKYRMWTEMATDDNAIKGVYAIEIGGIRFGQNSTTTNLTDSNGDTSSFTTNKGGGYSGDGVNVETRWAYTDFMLGNGRLKVGLQPWSVNPYLWTETATAVSYGASAGNVDYTVGWARGKEYFNTSTDDAFDEDQDAFMGRVNFGIGDGSKAGAFVLYQMSNPSGGTTGAISSMGWQIKKFGDVDMSIWTLGVDGKLQTGGPLFVKWDLMYQNGKIENATFTDSFSGMTSGANTDFDLSAYFAHLDVGAKLGKVTITYTGWYASGDDDAADDNFDAFLTTDVDRTESIALMEGGYTDDRYFSERNTFYDKGMFLNKLAVDFQVNDKTKLGGAVLYMQTAEDVQYTDSNGVARSSSDLGLEFDAYISYKMYKNLEIALNAGYLFSGDAMDVFETTKNGSSDEDIFRSTARFRYSF